LNCTTNKNPRIWIFGVQNLGFSYQFSSPGLTTQFFIQSLADSVDCFDGELGMLRIIVVAVRVKIYDAY